jgi:transglutaminase-like putative cysteine protease
MRRRDFLRTTGIISAGLAFPNAKRLFAADSAPDGWRTFEVSTRVEVLKSSGTTRIWVPAAIGRPTPFQKTVSNTFNAEGGTAKIVESNAADSLGIVSAEYPAGVTPILTVTSKIATRDYSVDFAARQKAGNDKAADLQHFLRPTKFLPTDGVVKTTADEITKNAKTDVEKARAIYEWIVDNTFRNPKTRGCGTGDIRFMLETRDFGGKCADLNALFVGLARAAGLPARDVYGIQKKSRSRSTAARKYISRNMAGCRSIPPTCEKLF